MEILVGAEETFKKKEKGSGTFIAIETIALSANLIKTASFKNSFLSLQV